MIPDYYLLDELLTDEARGVRDRVRAFVDSDVLPVINDYWDRAEFPWALVPKLAGLGVATRGGAAWGSLGHAAAAYEIALDYAKRREQFGKPIASFQLVQHQLAGMLAEITAMQLYCFRMAQLQEQGRWTGPMASLAKMNHARKARQICLDARDILGGNGLLLENHVARHLTDVEVVHTYEGTDNIQTLLVGRDITGISAIA